MGYFLVFSGILGAFELSDMADRYMYILHFRDFNLLYQRSVHCFSGYDKISHLSLSANEIMGKKNNGLSLYATNDLEIKVK